MDQGGRTWGIAGGSIDIHLPFVLLSISWARRSLLPVSNFSGSESGQVESAAQCHVCTAFSGRMGDRGSVRAEG